MNRLYKMVERNCTLPFSFYCISDKDTLFKCQIGESNPFKLDIVDMGEDIEVNIHFFFKANL